jgi:hypothetical protein
VIEGVLLAGEGLALTRGEECVAVGVAEVVGLEGLIGQFLGVLQDLERQRVILWVVEGRRARTYLVVCVGIGRREVVLAGYFLQVAEELVQLYVVLPVLCLLVDGQGGL